MQHERLPRLASFAKTMRERYGIIEDFDESLWGCMVKYVMVGRNKEMTVTFRDGTEIQACRGLRRRASALRQFFYFLKQE